MRGDVGGRRDRYRAPLDGMLQLWSAVLDNLAGAGNAALANIEQLGSSANWQTLAMLIGTASVANVASFAATIARCDFTQMPALEVQANDITRPDHRRGYGVNVGSTPAAMQAR